MSLPIYLDHHATTPVDRQVAEAMQPFLSEDFGNPASAGHVYGWRAQAAVEKARESLAIHLGASDPREIVFTSGATESNNLALQGVLRPRLRRGPVHVVTVATEHSAVLDPCRALVAEGCSATLLPVAPDGLIDLAQLADAVTDDTALISVMAANNEIGVLQPLAEIAALCRDRGVLFHSDAAQAVGKVPLSASELGVDLLSVSGHKVYGPKGIGALYVRSGRPRIRLEPLLYGGGHERGFRAGTLPTHLIVGFARAVELCVEEREAEATRLAALRDGLLQTLRDHLGGVSLNGHPTLRLPGNLHVSFDGIDADQLIADVPEVAISTGSACTSNEPRPSHVLAALGHSEERVRSGIRIGLGRGTDAGQIARAAAAIVRGVKAQRVSSGTDVYGSLRSPASSS